MAGRNQPLPEDYEPAAMDHDEIMFRVKTQGWVILPQVIPPDAVRATREDMERVYHEEQSARVNHVLNFLDHSAQPFSKYLASPRVLEPVTEIFVSTQSPPPVTFQGCF